MTGAPSITLNMIVKDEEATIVRCLDSALPFVDRIDIVDTGSTDRTIDLTYEWADNVPIPCTVVHLPWTDFATARNQALDLARGSGATYALILDADDTVEGNRMDIFDLLQGDTPGFNVLVRHGAIEHYRPHLVRLGAAWRWEGAVHEYLTLDTEPPPYPVLRLAITVGEGGARSRDPLKFLKDADLINEAMKGKISQGLRLRYCFYLAQSYRDASHSGAAIYWYKVVYDADGWVEERYIAALNLGRLTGDLDWFLRAARLNPKRAEAWRALHLHDFADRCVPDPSFLFLESAAYAVS